jgi:hypothetical protein
MNLRFELVWSYLDLEGCCGSSSSSSMPRSYITVLPIPGARAVPVAPLYEIRICRTSANFQKLFK